MMVGDKRMACASHESHQEISTFIRAVESMVPCHVAKKSKPRLIGSHKPEIMQVAEAPVPALL